MKDSSNSDPFIELCKNSDAYYLFNNVKVKYKNYWYFYKKYTTIYNKIVINNSNGVENFAFLRLDKFQSNHLVNIRVRTLKANGTKVNLDSSIVFTKSSKDKKFDAIDYPIPSVEPGDTIETSYTFYEKLKKKNLKNYAFIHSNIPSLESNFSIKTGPELVMKYKVYNEFPEPEVLKSDSLVHVQFSIKKLKDFQENNYSCYPCELPYLYYSLESHNSNLRTWKDVYNEEFNLLTQPLALDSERINYYKRWKRKLIGEAKDSTKFYQFKLIYEEILNNFTIEEPKSKEFIKSSGYFLKHKRFDELSIKRFYRRVLEDLNIEYWAVFAKSKRAGQIDLDFIRKGEFDHIFFAFKDERGNVKFIYPHNNSFMYQFNEIPVSLYNTSGLFVKPALEVKKKKKELFVSKDLQFAEVDSVNISKVIIPGMNSTYNRISQVIFADVELNQKNVNIKSRLRVSGGLSTELRQYLKEINKNKELRNFYDALHEFEGDNTVKIDSVLNINFNRNRPFSYIMNSKGTLNNTISFTNKKFLSLSLNKLLNHNKIESNSKNSRLDYYLDFKFSDDFQIYINFPTNIEVLGIKNGKSNIVNDLGSYNFEIAQIKSNQIKIKSSYIINKDFLPKEKTYLIGELNDELKKIKNKRFLIKLKNN